LGLVQLYATLRPRAGGKGTVEVPWSRGDTVGDVVRELIRRKPGLRGYILDEDGQVLPFVNVFLNGRDIRFFAGLETRVDGGSDVAIFPPVAGG
jgi:molybdopterin synthase sulfur carrier subunit